MTSNKSMFKVEVEGQEAMLVPSRELADTMSALFENAIVTPVGRKDASAFVRQATAKVEIPSVWLDLLNDVETLVTSDNAFAKFVAETGPTHGAVALCAVVDAHKQKVTLTVKNVAGKASPGKAYADLNGEQYPSLSAYIHANGGTVTSIYPMQGARQYNRDADRNPKSLKQVEVKA